MKKLALVVVLAGAVACATAEPSRRPPATPIGPEAEWTHTSKAGHSPEGKKFCGCDIAAPCSDCCSPKDCACGTPHDPTR